MSHADREAIDWDLVDDLAFGCLEHEGTARDEAFARACADHPDLAPVLRRCMERLAEAGLLRDKGTQHLPSGLRHVYDGSMAAEASPAESDEHGRSALEREGAGTAPPDSPYARDNILDQRSERPEQIGPYRILDALGQGGMGTVYLAEQCRPSRNPAAADAVALAPDRWRRGPRSADGIGLRASDSRPRAADAVRWTTAPGATACLWKGNEVGAGMPRAS